MIRLFVALSLPESVRLRLSTLGGGVPGARWLKPENLHLTLRFIGEVDHGAADDLDAALGGIVAPAFDITLASVGYFGKTNAARLLWAGVQPNDALNRLQSKVEAAVTQAGFQAEQRRFSPHVTLARLKRAPAGRIEEFVANQAGFHTGPITINHFTLFSSFLSAKGAIYTPETEFGLIG